MTVEQMMELAKAGKTDELESAWMEAIEQGLGLDKLTSVLDAAVKAEQLNAAETLGWALLAARTEQLPPAQALPIAQAVVMAVPISGDLRAQAGELYRKVHGSHEYFEPLLRASGLLASQSPKRAFRTLDTCLAIRDGAYLANRFDGQVLQAHGYHEIMDEFETVDAGGRAVRVEPKVLADEFEIVDEKDFRVLCQHRRGDMGKLMETDPAGVLIGVCMVHGGQIDAGELKDMLVPEHMEASKWADWWSRARTSAKRSPHLSLSGRSPVVISYHAGGQTLEQEMSADAAAAKAPLARLAVLQQYARQARDRKSPTSAEFTGPIMQALAQQAREFMDKRPGDALAATLTIDFAKGLGMAAAGGEYPSAQDVLAETREPARAAAELCDTPLWNQALQAIQQRPDAVKQLQALLDLVGTGELDDVAALLTGAGQTDMIDQAAAKAMSDPAAHLEFFIWLWKSPTQPLTTTPGKVELLCRMLKMAQEMEHDWAIPAAKKKAAFQRIRQALLASDSASFRQALAAMDEGVAGAVKRLIERNPGLTEATREDLLGILRESFYMLFVKEKVAIWLDESTIWTTEAALHLYEAQLKNLIDVEMPKNAKAIGAAAAHGDLSENSEWKFAIEEHDMLVARVRKMNEELAKARIISPETAPNESVGVGSKVTLRRLSDGADIELSFLGPWDSNMESSIYSYQTQLAKDLMGKVAADRATLKIGNREDEYEIVALGSAI